MLSIVSLSPVSSAAVCTASSLIVLSYSVIWSRTVLATAAPEDYAKAVAAECGFDFLLASRAETEECKGEEKLRRIKALCEYNGLHIRNVMTDHHDDLPLLKLPGVENVLVDPSVETIKILNNQSIKYIILK